MPSPIPPLGTRPASRARRAHIDASTASTQIDRIDRIDHVEAVRRTRVPALTTIASGSMRVTGTPLVDGVSFKEGALVVDGVRIAVRPTTSPGRAASLVEAALRLAGTGAFSKLTQTARRSLADALEKALVTRERGRASLTLTRVHAGCFALLEELSASCRAGTERPLRTRMRAALEDAARFEAHAPLEMHMKGRLDGTRAERVFVPAPPFPDRRSISFRPDPRAVPDDVAHQALARAVTRLDALFGSWAAPFGNAKARAAAGALSPTGFFDDAGTSAVRVRARGAEFEVALDRRFSRMDPDAIAMLVTYEGTRALLARAHPDASEHQSRMIALSMVARLVHDDIAHADIADLLLERFARAHGFPPSLSFAAVDKAMRAEGSAHASPQMTALLERAMEYSFLEVNSRRTSTDFRRYVGQALELLMRSPHPVGRRTYEAIATGKVHVDELSDLNAADYARLRRDFEKDGVHVHERKEGSIDRRSMRAITTSIAGYMWDDRVYVARGMDPADVARALVHEVNHVLNASEEHYRGDRATLAEEYRAFYAEELFVGRAMTPARCRKLKERVIRDYGLDDVTAADVPDVPPGIV